MKPISEWLKELPSGYREIAESQCDNCKKEVSNLAFAIIWFTSKWRNTREGAEFWGQVYDWAEYPTINKLPLLPQQPILL